MFRLLVILFPTSYNNFMKIDISHLAKLANLPISEAEKKLLAKQLEETLKHVERLKEINTDKAKETNEVNNLKNVWREDEVRPSLSQEKALMNAPQIYNGFFVVPGIMGEENE